MEITKAYLENMLKSTLAEYSSSIVQTKETTLKYVDYEQFIGDALMNPINQTQINMGLYKDFKEEYPGFVVVYSFDKTDMCYVLFGSYKISVCFELASKRLSRLNEKQSEAYLKHLFAHEITHIMSDAVKVAHPEIFEQCKNESDVPELQEELLAEYIADLITDSKSYNEANAIVWGAVIKRIMDLRNGV